MSDKSSNERATAVTLADHLLDEPYADPDDDLRVLSRQLLRRHEEIEGLKAGRRSRGYPDVAQHGAEEPERDVGHLLAQCA